MRWGGVRRSEGQCLGVQVVLLFHVVANRKKISDVEHITHELPK